MSRSPLLLHTLLEYNGRRSSNQRRRSTAADTPRMSPRELRHLQRAAIALRSAGAFARAGVPGALKLARASKSGVSRSGVTGFHLPTDIMYKLAARGARRDFPAAGIKWGRFASISTPHPRYQYGRGALF